MAIYRNGIEQNIYRNGILQNVYRNGVLVSGKLDTFKFDIDTRQTQTSPTGRPNNTKFILPFAQASAEYPAKWRVDWGDGTRQYLYSELDNAKRDVPESHHTYSEPGAYTISLSPLDSNQPAWLAAFGGRGDFLSYGNSSENGSMIRKIYGPLSYKRFCSGNNVMLPTLVFARGYDFSLSDDFTFDDSWNPFESYSSRLVEFRQSSLKHCPIKAPSNVENKAAFNFLVNISLANSLIESFEARFYPNTRTTINYDNNSTFANCRNLFIPPDLRFYNPPANSSRGYNKMFQNAGTNVAQTARALDIINGLPEPAWRTYCFDGCTTLPDYNDIPPNWK